MGGLTTSSINDLVNSFKDQQTKRLVEPLKTRKEAYSKTTDAYNELSKKLTALKSLLNDFKLTGNDSVFKPKTVKSSNKEFVDAIVTNAASKSSYQFFVNQLAKSDIAVSQDMVSATANALSGNHSFIIKTGDGNGGEFISHVDLDLTTSETNKTLMEKVRDAINIDKAEVESTAKVGTDAYAGGTSTITLDINGTETNVTVNGGGTYENLIDELVGTINTNVDGVTAEKISNAGNVSLKLTVNDSDNYVSISHSSGFDLVTDLGISVTQEKGASGIVSATMFTPKSGYSQFSITAKNTGLDYRITDMSDDAGTVLSALSLNLGATRPAFDQTQDPDTPGFVYSDITDANNLLNSKFKFNGLDIQKSSNEIEDLVNGVTFNLNSEMQVTDKEVNLSVSNNSEEVRTKISDFIEKFNDIYTYIRESSKRTQGVKGAFYGDSNASAVLSILQSVTYSQVAGLPANDISYLAQIGVSLDYDTGLSVKDSKLLEEKLKDNAEQVEALFNSDNGIGNILYDKVLPYLGSDGYIFHSKENISSSSSYLGDRIKKVETRIDKSADLMRSKYQRMQIMLSSMMSSYSMFSGIGNNSLDQFFS